jgi:hypothetical protein
MNGAEASSKDVIFLMSKLICICHARYSMHEHTGRARHTYDMRRTVQDADSSAYFIAAVETCTARTVKWRQRES